MTCAAENGRPSSAPSAVEEGRPPAAQRDEGHPPAPSAIEGSHPSTSSAMEGHPSTPSTMEESAMEKGCPLASGATESRQSTSGVALLTTVVKKSRYPTLLALMSSTPYCLSPSTHPQGTPRSSTIGPLLPAASPTRPSRP